MAGRLLTVTIEPCDGSNDLVVRHRANIVECHSDEMEPEDATFLRDLEWIKEAIIKAYDLGRLDEWEAHRDGGTTFAD